MLEVTETAATKLQALITEKGLVNYGLRVFVQGGGCSGIQYGMMFDSRQREGDQVFQAMGGLNVYVDETSLFYVDGAKIDYIETAAATGFRIENPKAEASRGCSCSSCGDHAEGEGGGCCN